MRSSVRVVETTNGRRARGHLRADFFHAPLQEAALGLAVGELERALVLRACLVAAAEPPEQVSPRGVEVLVAVEVEPLDQGEPGLASLRLGHRDRAVELD